MMPSMLSQARSSGMAGAGSGARCRGCMSPSRASLCARRQRQLRLGSLVHLGVAVPVRETCRHVCPPTAAAHTQCRHRCSSSPQSASRRRYDLHRCYHQALRCSRFEHLFHVKFELTYVYRYPQYLRYYGQLSSHLNFVHFENY